MQQVSYGPPYVHMVPQHVKCLHVLYASDGSPIPYIEYELYGPPACTYGPPHVQYDVNNYYSPPYLIWNVRTL